MCPPPCHMWRHIYIPHINASTPYHTHVPTYIHTYVRTCMYFERTYVRTYTHVRTSVYVRTYELTYVRSGTASLATRRFLTYVYVENGRTYERSRYVAYVCSFIRSDARAYVRACVRGEYVRTYDTPALRTYVRTYVRTVSDPAPVLTYVRTNGASAQSVRT